MKTFALTAILMLTLAGCGKADQEWLTVYSFSGENEQFTVSNGVVVLTDTEEIFDGGDLKITDDLLADITSYTTTFYMMTDNGKEVILSNSVEDMTGGTVNVPGDLGRVSGDGILIPVKIDDTSDLESSLYFELTTVDKTGVEDVYQLQMSLTEITKNIED